MRAAQSYMASKSLRLTTSRLRLLTTLCDSDRPLTLAEIQQRVESLPTSSLYRNVIALETSGVLRRVTGTDGYARFELGDSIDRHHHHLICSECGNIADVEIDADLERQLEHAAMIAQDSVGFRVTDHTFDMHGVCRDCAE